jgi:hypothetical protein
MLKYHMITKAQANQAICEYIEVYNNRQRMYFAIIVYEIVCTSLIGSEFE